MSFVYMFIALVIFLVLRAVLMLFMPSIVANMIVDIIMGFILSLLYLPDRKSFYKNLSFYRGFFIYSIIFLLIDCLFMVI